MYTHIHKNTRTNIQASIQVCTTPSCYLLEVEGWTDTQVEERRDEEEEEEGEEEHEVEEEEEEEEEEEHEAEEVEGIFISQKELDEEFDNFNSSPSPPSIPPSNPPSIPLSNPPSNSPSIPPSNPPSIPPSIPPCGSPSTGTALAATKVISSRKPDGTPDVCQCVVAETGGICNGPESLPHPLTILASSREAAYSQVRWKMRESKDRRGREGEREREGGEEREREREVGVMKGMKRK